MAHKKGQGSSRNGRDSNPSYLGLKVADGQSVLSGTIILKQRGTKFHPGFNVKRANDDSLFATSDGLVKFARKGRNRKGISHLCVDCGRRRDATRGACQPFVGSRGGRIRSNCTIWPCSRSVGTTSHSRRSSDGPAWCHAR